MSTPDFSTLVARRRAYFRTGATRSPGTGTATTRATAGAGGKGHDGREKRCAPKSEECVSHKSPSFDDWPPSHQGSALSGGLRNCACGATFVNKKHKVPFLGPRKP